VRVCICAVVKDRLKLLCYRLLLGTEVLDVGVSYKAMSFKQRLEDVLSERTTDGSRSRFVLHVKAQSNSPHRYGNGFAAMDRRVHRGSDGSGALVLKSGSSCMVATSLVGDGFRFEASHVK